MFNNENGNTVAGTRSVPCASDLMYMCDGGAIDQCLDIIPLLEVEVPTIVKC
jgi:hypothetical protein